MEARGRASAPAPMTVAGDEERPRGQSTLLARLLRRQSIGALTGRGAFPCHGLRSHNRLQGAASWNRARCSSCLEASVLAQWDSRTGL
jgi:hypothetical protein